MTFTFFWYATGIVFITDSSAERFLDELIHILVLKIIAINANQS